MPQLIPRSRMVHEKNARRDGGHGEGVGESVNLLEQNRRLCTFQPCATGKFLVERSPGFQCRGVKTSY